MAGLIKSASDIETLRQSGKILAQAMTAAVEAVRSGINTEELENIVVAVITKAGGKPAFKGYKIHPQDPPFPSALCVSINEEIVHGSSLPNRVLKEGDIVGLDLGVNYKDRFTDMARTVAVGKVGQSARQLIKVTRESLAKGLSQVKSGNFVSDISQAIQNHLETNGFGVVRELVGHGVGYAVHEEPVIPNYVGSNQPKIKLQAGMVLAIEPMSTLGNYAVKTLKDGWTVVTQDGSLSAHFEDTVVVTDSGYELLTK
ncbi:MAG: type I methionyl aminopeptidase [Candidatus Buchananbacteria bacterium CG10_big_fil_rev_8_21_14_0_10_42_9]|uniref:Methionine aminopeptidase n=1 Tax=Candidatus Buchananbacteria bacterium CG10_big_fil_rev_8_21_14_0_10_42_9 TaxID=1974526 RepID=A0A2H0W252_9BACT|nr:MAG: type I methionyl aminopeptidase [Candidatus Buchananbacteria bacterium CG10_big_fil_rev_8_21_14_0_10_42_9]